MNTVELKTSTSDGYMYSEVEIDIPTDILMHYGMPRRSGRYPWGSGENPYQRTGDFASRVAKMREEGFTYTDPETGITYKGDAAIARSMGMTTTDFRAMESLAKDERRLYKVETAKSLREKGYTLQEIADQMGLPNESSVRALLSENAEARMEKAFSTADFLMMMVDEKGMIDVGKGVEIGLDISSAKLNEALMICQLDGYEIYSGRINQVTNPGQMTTIKVLCPAGTEHKEIFNTANVHSLNDYQSYDDGETYQKKFSYPSSMDSSRLKIVYGDEGGSAKDGLIEIRRGVADLDLGTSRYAQVRILVDGTHYLKGMAAYSDDLPDGIDVLFNTNKKSGTPTTEVLKKIKSDPDNPFGALIKSYDPKTGKSGQSYYTDEDGNKKLSLINKKSEEGDWGEWSHELPSQFLSKQNLKLINSQLSAAIQDKTDEYNSIMMVTNPTVRKSLLSTYANDCDSAAVHLKAAALPRQSYQVLFPLTTISDTKVYAPNYTQGEKVALIRYPHAGTFEIPILTVDNTNSEAISYLGKNPADVVGISAKVAQQLSGADFDGDTVMVIPCNSSNSKVRITATSPLKALENFDSKLDYGPDSLTIVKTDSKGNEYYSRNGHTYKAMTKTQTQTEMGKISNLITDMTLQSATEDELARAVKHSMVVIDAEKHKLDYKASATENDIESLKKKYQKHTDDDGYGGASTLISRASAETRILKTQGSPRINKDTGELEWKTVEETYVDKNGKTQVRTKVSTQMADTNDAYTLSSGTVQEAAYADYANTMKALANQARLTMISTPTATYSSSAAKTYATEVSSLLNKLKTAQANAPKERQAQLIANATVKAKKEDNPGMTKEEIKKAGQQALSSARVQVGASRQTITLTDKEIEAIQAGAISDTKFSEILKYVDIDTVRDKFTSSSTTEISTAMINKIKNYAANGHSQAEIAEKLGISTTTVNKYLNA